MKQALVSLFLVTYLFISLLVLNACSQGKSPEINYDYVDQNLYITYNNTLYKINPITAVGTPVCPDPLCLHNDTTCCFYLASEKQFVGQYIYYMRDGRPFEFNTKICRFDLQSGEYEIIYETDEGSMTYLFASERYLFFNHILLTSEGKYKFSVCRFDTATNESVTISDTTLGKQRPYAFEDNRVYWLNELTYNYYSTDIHYEDMKENDKVASADKQNGRYYYNLEKSSYDEDHFTQLFRLTRIDPGSGDKLVVFENVGCFPILYHEKIIYSKLGEPRFVGYILDEATGSYEPLYDVWGGKYYICDSDGSNERLLCDISSTEYVIPVLPDGFSERGKGDWIAVFFPRYTSVGTIDGKNIVEYDSSQYVFINIVTGEIKEIEMQVRS